MQGADWQHGIRQKRDDGGVKKTLTASVGRADEGTLARLVVEASILLAASRDNPTVILKEAAAIYKVDTDALTTPALARRLCVFKFNPLR